METKTMKEREKVMSFCGMILTTEGIVAFADSKATKKSWIGIDVEDKDRYPQKIIKNNDIIIVATGNNYILSENKTKYIKLEDAMNDILFIFSKYERKDINKLFSLIKSMLQFSLDKESNFHYKFLVGFKTDNYVIYELEFSSKLECLSKPVFARVDSHCYKFIGDSAYCQIFEQIKWEKVYSLEEYQGIICKLIESIIDINEVTRFYNPVGLPICVDIFQ